MQDGFDLIAALARHPATAHRLARRLWGFFVSEQALAERSRGERAGQRLHAERRQHQAGAAPPVHVRGVLNAEFQRYAWPVEFVVRSVKETGWNGFSVDAAMTPLVNMGQQLYEPPDVNGWALGGEWFSTASMLARMNFAATLMGNQKFNLGRELQNYRQSPERVVDFMLNHFTYSPMSTNVYDALLEYARGGGAWTGNDAQLNNKGAGLARLIVASSEYQFN